MANNASPLSYLAKREQGLLPRIRSSLFSGRLNVAKNLYRRDLVCHFGCVNAIEFSNNGELLISGGDDRRIMVWQFGKAILDQGQPEAMKAQHQSNIFCLGITSDNKRIYSGGNDDIVLVHDVENKSPIEMLAHQRAVCGLSIDPFNERVVATAGNDGRLLLFDTRSSVHESLVISRSRKAFHAVTFHPRQSSMVASANARDGLSLWDLRSPKHPAVRYSGSRNNSACQNSMSVRFNATGSLVLALRRRQPPVLYSVLCPEPRVEFYHQDYYNSCTMKSCSFAGEGDRYVLSGSDDFNLYMWRVPAVPADSDEVIVEPPHIVLYGHRSIVNQVRYNPQYCLIASSGVEKIIKVWSAMEYPGMRGALLEEARGPDNPREIYSHEDYVSLVHHSGQYISHNYVDQSTNEDPRMMAFFDSLVQRELECLAEESDSLDGSSSGSENSNASDSSDSEQIVVDFLPLPPKRVTQPVTRSQRCPNRLARIVASRYPKSHGRSHRRGLLRRAPGRPARLAPPPAPRLGRPRRPAPRPARRPPPPRSSERTSSEDCERYTERTMIIRPSRRRVNLTRAGKRKSNCSIYRKPTNRSNGSLMIRDVADISSFNNFEDNIAIPSTSSGYRGQSSSTLFRIVEVDSDDDHSTSSRPLSPHNNNNNNNTNHNNIPNNLVGVVPTPLNGSRDPMESDSNSTLPDTRLRRRSRRTNRPSLHRSDSSESPPHLDPERSTTPTNDRLASSHETPQTRPAHTHNRTVQRLMNETNESELESSCSTEGTLWSATASQTPDSGVGSAPRAPPPAGDVSDDPDLRYYQAIVFRQRVKKARRNYRNQMDSDSNNSN